MAIIAQLANTLGEYIDFKRGELLEQYMQKCTTETHMRTILSDAQEGSKVAIPSDHLGEVVQNFQPVFTGKGDLTTGAETITQRRHKVNVPVNPDTIVGEWEGVLYDEKKKREEMPITQYIMAKIPPKVEEDKELQMVFKGSYVAPTAGVASPAIESVDGLKKVMDDAATASKYTKFLLGAFTPDQTFEYVENFFTSIPEISRMKKMKLFMSETNVLNYQKDKRNTFQWQQTMEQLLKVDFSNIQIVGLPSMAGSNRMFACPDGNLVRIIHKNPGADNIEAIREPYVVKIMADWHTSYGIADFRYFWSNNVA